ncbi:PRELI-like family-domain-containing protein [Pseudomassariella vexata]|uniref:PRELI-like family-domain-containing protein n=1 Tax=Pseudomassariella vexata TaxID=1141098 RepID=A0A1Y2EC52_9PEZI|nr:PRELI-like family-domain-containing protein [Pseudomassariella vexata]ORY68987.1 PRELI-like family-domain-containing protein [Pseudomassariella vexata]
MVLTHTTNHSYAHPFPTVTLAFFLRYYSPQLNPFSSHVLSTDTISSHVDPATGRLHTTRIHLKKSRMPSAVIKLLPTSVTGGAGDKSTYVVETSTVDIREGWMKTESRNLNFTGVLSVTEQQHYSVTPPDQSPDTKPSLSPATSSNTYVSTTFSYRSSLGNRKVDKAVATSDDPNRSRFGGWISGWGAKRIQSSIESIASNKTDDQMVKSRDGMGMVLERLRSNGVVAVLRELRRREGNVFEQSG